MSEAESTGNVVSRAEHHADSDVDRVRRAKDQIAWILRRRDCREYAISSQGLADATPVSSSTVRDCIREIRNERNLPIESCSQGYYLIGSVAELERYVEKKRDEIATHEETLQKQVEAFNSMRYEGES